MQSVTQIAIYKFDGRTQLQFRHRHSMSESSETSATVCSTELSWIKNANRRVERSRRSQQRWGPSKKFASRGKWTIRKGSRADREKRASVLIRKIDESIRAQRCMALDD